MTGKGSVTVSESDDLVFEVRVRPEYLGRSDDGNFHFAYHIAVHNQSDETVQLLSRRWTITDGEGKAQQVSGKGVIGQQPHIHGQSSFSYTSGVHFPTPVGYMEGEYLMTRRDGRQFEIAIGVFTLSAPKSMH